ncbi:MAG: PilT/PilU family type 4a pilus ATPase [Sporomusaceae bacterium]|nr:PilT/PilU family type 4a pilus ATPase [Sporomusaceae bacterium]
MNLAAIFQEALSLGASDIHLTAQVPPVYRVQGELLKTEHPPLQKEDTESFFSEITAEYPEVRKSFQECGEVDFAYAPGFARYRVNAFLQRGTTALAIRVIKSELPTLEELGMPEIVKEFAKKKSGLILAAGAAGSGKSTTLAAMVDFINTERACHIITLEDPIEYWHHSQKSIINQRQIKRDSLNFAAALRASLRQDPDVILIGEMRDAETMAVAITAAETGHLVLATLHTKSASSSVARIIDAFPPHQRGAAQSQLAYVLEGVIAQELVFDKKSQQRKAAAEILVATSAVKNLIREGKIHQIDSLIQTGAQFGMQTKEHALKKLHRQEER